MWGQREGSNKASLQGRGWELGVQSKNSQFWRPWTSGLDQNQSQVTRGNKERPRGPEAQSRLFKPDENVRGVLYSEDEGLSWIK